MLLNRIFRKVIFIGLILSTSLNLSAQYSFANTYLSFGYQVGFGSFNEMNSILDRYELSSPNIDKGFRSIQTPSGLAVSLGGYYDFAFAEIGFTQRLQTRSLTYIDLSDDIYQRDIRMSLNSYHFSLGLGGPIGDDLILGLGGSLEIGQIRGKTKETLSNDIKDLDYAIPVKETDLFSTIFIQIMLGDPEATRPKFIIQPYYTFGFGTANFTALNQAVNPDTFQNDPVPLRQNIGHFGIKLSMATFISF